MIVGAIGGESMPYAPAAKSNGGETAQSLQRQKEMLEQQLETAKARSKNSQSDQDAAKKQIEKLEKKIAEIDKKLQKMTSEEQQDREGQSAHGASYENNKKSEATQLSSLSSFVQSGYDKSSGEEPELLGENSLINRFKSIGRMIDTYA